MIKINLNSDLKNLTFCLMVIGLFSTSLASAANWQCNTIVKNIGSGQVVFQNADQAVLIVDQRTISAEDDGFLSTVLASGTGLDGLQLIFSQDWSDQNEIDLVDTNGQPMRDGGGPGPSAVKDFSRESNVVHFQVNLKGLSFNLDCVAK